MVYQLVSSDLQENNQILSQDTKGLSWSGRCFLLQLTYYLLLPLGLGSTALNSFWFDRHTWWFSQTCPLIVTLLPLLLAHVVPQACNELLSHNSYISFKMAQILFPPGSCPWTVPPTQHHPMCSSMSFHLLNNTVRLCFYFPPESRLLNWN